MSYGGKETVLVGPWGGLEGQHWDDGVYSAIRQVEIGHGAVIDSIRFQYDLNGRSFWSQTHGGNGGTKIDIVKLDQEDEFLTRIHGYYGSSHEHGPVFVRSLTLESNKRNYGPFGIEQGNYFASPKMEGKIVGFLGKSGWFLDAIGVYIEPIQNQNSVYYSQQYDPSSIFHPTEKYEYSMIQGSLGSNYDLIVAVRKRDDHSTPINLSPQISHNYINTQPKINQNVNIPRSVESKVERLGSKSITGVVTSGPWGGGGGTIFDDGVYDGVRQINLYRNVCIVGIRVCYEQNAQLVWGSKNGGTGAFKNDKIPFDHPSEILTHVSGYIGAAMVMGPSVIKSLTFHTTKGKYGPYGEEEGEFFTTKLKEGSMIVGFHGRKGLFLDAIGVHVLEGKVSSSSSSHNKNPMLPSPTKVSPSKSTNQTPLVPKKDGSDWPFKIGKRDEVHRMVKDPAPYGAGPWGGEGGKPWDDGVFTGIKQIILTITDAICCMEIEYDQNGQSIWSVKHGGPGGQTANRVKLDYPNEVLTCITGYCGPIKKDQGNKVIHSLTFHTSRRKYGPFGEELGAYFASGTTEGKVVGFHGRSGVYLDAIGVHQQHWLGNKRSPNKASSLMKMFS